MKIIAVNGSPRKNGNTAALLNCALDGAKAAGAETGFIQLSDLNYKGCMSCFACKLITGSHRCTWNDELKPALAELEKADGVIMGSPIYFMRLTAMMEGFLERFIFQYYTYNNETPSVFPGRLKTAFIYTMNATEEFITPFKGRLNTSEAFAEKIFGAGPELLYSCNTWQYPDYDRYEHACFSVEDKARQKREQFPKDCEAAYDLGAKMARGK